MQTALSCLSDDGIVVAMGAQAPRLLDQVRAAIRARHYSRRTEEAYVYWIRRYIVFHGRRHPRSLGAEEISSFVTWLAVDQHVAASTQNQALSAVLFLYNEVLCVDIGSVVVPPRAQLPGAMQPREHAAIAAVGLHAVPAPLGDHQALCQSDPALLRDARDGLQKQRGEALDTLRRYMLGSVLRDSQAVRVWMTATMGQYAEQLRRLSPPKV